MGTPDYFNSCSDVFSEISIPQNIFGYQQTMEGNAYIGLILLYVDFNNEKPEYREYIQTKINHCLTSGQEYYLEFFVNKSNIYGIAIDKIGAFFSTDPISKNDAEVLNVEPQIFNQHHQVITDTISWTKISGTFIASGNECYLTIGNFYSIEETDTIIFNPDWPDDYAYYYFDGILLIEVESKIQVPNVFTPNGDNFNDLFIADYTSIINFEAFIYNRWGQQLYSWINPNEGWDGKYNGFDCPEGVYFYTINAKGIEGKIYNLNGSFQLLR